MGYNYSFQNFDKQTMARACGVDLGISLKKSVEVASHIRGKKVSFILSYLEKVTEQKAVVPFKRYNSEMPHKKGAGICSGGYPVFVAREFIRLLKSAQKNAQEQSIDDELYITAVSVRKGSSKYHYGRYSGRKMKSTNLEIVVGSKIKGDKK